MGKEQCAVVSLLKLRLWLKSGDVDEVLGHRAVPVDRGNTQSAGEPAFIFEMGLPHITWMFEHGHRAVCSGGGGAGGGGGG